MKSEDFLRYIRYELNLSACTVLSYKNDLRQLSDYLTGDGKEEFEAAGVTPGDIRAWIASLSREGLSSRSIRRKVQAVRAFYKYLILTGEVTENPAADVELAKVRKPLPVFVREENINELIDEEIDNSDFEEVRDKLIIMMLYETGIRRAELIGLKDKDVDEIKGELKVLGKRNKERIVPFGRELADRISEYRLMRAEQVGGASTESFFVRQTGEPMYPMLVHRIVHTQLTQAGGSSRQSPHVLRHTFASAMLNGGADLNSVKELLGHESLAATQVYTHITFRELKSNYEHAHPRALKKGG